MDFTPLGINGVWLAESPVWNDERGFFREWFKKEEIEKNTGQIFEVSQANFSRSSKGTLRGIHYSLSPAGQAKWITCTNGMIQDVIVDLRKNSSTFGQSIEVELSAGSGRSIFICKGLGHGFLALEDNTSITYLLSSVYEPFFEFEINPLDIQLGINWGIERKFLKISEKDRNAPSLAERIADKNLP